MSNSVPDWLKDMEDPEVLPRALGLSDGKPGYGHREMRNPSGRPLKSSDDPDKDKPGDPDQSDDSSKPPKPEPKEPEEEEESPSTKSRQSKKK